MHCIFLDQVKFHRICYLFVFSLSKLNKGKMKLIKRTLLGCFPPWSSLLNESYAGTFYYQSLTGWQRWPTSVPPLLLIVPNLRFAPKLLLKYVDDIAAIVPRRQITHMLSMLNSFTIHSRTRTRRPVAISWFVIYTRKQHYHHWLVP